MHENPDAYDYGTQRQPDGTIERFYPWYCNPQEGQQWVAAKLAAVCSREEIARLEFWRQRWPHVFYVDRFPDLADPDLAYDVSAFLGVSTHSDYSGAA